MKKTKKVVAASKTTPQNHKMHVMKRVSSSMEEVMVEGHSLGQSQKRIVTKYVCVCKEEDLFYSQPNHPAFSLDSYSRQVTKK